MPRLEHERTLPPRHALPWRGLVVVACLSLVTGVAVRMGNRESGSSGEEAAPPRGTLTYEAGDADVRMLSLMSDPAGASPLAMNPQRQPLDREPLGLAPPPGAVPLERFRTVGGGLVDEVSFWRVPGGDAEALTKHYRDAADTAGLAPLATASGGSLLFTDPSNPGRALTVRLDPRRDGVHVTVWLRYAAQP